MLTSLLRALLTAWLAVTLVFLGMRLFAVDALSAQYLSAGLSTTELNNRREKLGLNQTALLQYVSYWSNLLRGDLGKSLYSPLSVAELIALRLPSSFGLAVSALALALPLGLGLALGAQTRSSILWRSIISLGVSLPIYWTGTLVIFGLGAILGGILQNPYLPVLVLGYHVACGIALGLRATLSQTYAQDFVRVAHAKGLAPRVIFWRHIVPHLYPALITLLALQFGFLLSGAVLTESLFLRAGLGTLLLDAILARDLPLIQGIVLILAFSYSLLNAGALAVVRWLDPRLRWA
jgi:peptide/nickel transport system permease protein